MTRVRDLIQGQELSVISKNETVRDAVDLMTRKNIGAVPVVEGTRVVGIFSERDLMTRVIAKDVNPQKVTIEKIMTKELIVASPDETLQEVMNRMRVANIRHLPVVEKDQLVGILSLRDLLQADLNEKDEEIKIMTAYIHYIPPTFEN